MMDPVAIVGMTIAVSLTFIFAVYAGITTARIERLEKRVRDLEIEAMYWEKE